MAKAKITITLEAKIINERSLDWLISDLNKSYDDVCDLLLEGGYVVQGVVVDDDVVVPSTAGSVPSEAA